MPLAVRLLTRMLPVAVVAAVLVFFAGCMSVNNNYLLPEDFKVYLERQGLTVDGVREISPAPFRATSGVAYMINGSEIGLYKYDQNSAIQRKRLARIAEEKCTYIIGIKYPVVVRGSFMLFGLEKNPQKKAILRAFENFN